MIFRAFACDYDGTPAPHDRSGESTVGIVVDLSTLQACRKALEVIPLQSVIFHAEREDFSRWIRDVFRDRVLPRQVRKIETRWRQGAVHWLRDALARPLAAEMAGLG